jgi:hypothetical protein
MSKVLVSVTTLENPKWAKQVEDLARFNIDEFAIFISCLNPTERQDLYTKLEKLKSIKVPFAHIRTDVNDSELEYLVKRFGLELCNIHPSSEFALQYEWKKYRKIILIENVIHSIIDEEELKTFGGICLDTAHLENHRLSDMPKYEYTVKLIQKYSVKANHISGILHIPAHIDTGHPERLCYDNHDVHSITEFNYLKNFPKDYFGKYLSIEVGNDIEAQLKIKEYIKKVLNIK